MKISVCKEKIFDQEVNKRKDIGLHLFLKYNNSCVVSNDKDGVIMGLSLSLAEFKELKEKINSFELDGAK